MAGGEKILIIDDEPNFLLALQTTLEAKAYQVITAIDKEEAQDKIRKEGPDLVVLGTMTPRGNAFNLHKWIKRNPGRDDSIIDDEDGLDCIIDFVDDPDLKEFLGSLKSVKSSDFEEEKVKQFMEDLDKYHKKYGR